MKFDQLTDQQRGERSLAEAVAIAKRVLFSQRPCRPTEQRRINSLLVTAEAMLCRMGIPRDPAELVRATRGR